jgi:hypothetical protein
MMSPAPKGDNSVSEENVPDAVDNSADAPSKIGENLDKTKDTPDGEVDKVLIQLHQLNILEASTKVSRMEVQPPRAGVLLSNTRALEWTSAHLVDHG